MADDQFERQKLCYEQNFQQARTLNTQMVQVPLASITLTGGLWFGAGAVKDLDDLVRFGLLILACISNLSLILVTARIRQVFRCYLEKIQEFCPESFVEGKIYGEKAPILQDQSMVMLLCVQLGLAACMSAGAAIHVYWPFHGCKIAGWMAFSIVFGLFLFLAFYRRRLDRP